jgi:hypothetical protein
LKEWKPPFPGRDLLVRPADDVRPGAPTAVRQG